jgi:hypothetical protein
VQAAAQLREAIDIAQPAEVLRVIRAWKDHF